MQLQSSPIAHSTHSPKSSRQSCPPPTGIVSISGQLPSDSISVPLKNTSTIRSVSISLGGGAGDDALTLLAAAAGRDGNISLGTGQDVLTASNIRAARSLRFSDAEAASPQMTFSVMAT